MSTLARIWTAPDRFLATRPGPNADSLAIYRAVYAAFAIWHLSFQRASLADIPGFATEVPLLRILPELSSGTRGVLESLLVGALVLLGFGWRVRLMTAVVLVLGTYEDALFTNLDHEHGTAILVFWIPLCMLVFDGWDGVERRARSLAPAVLLVALSIWFFSAGVWKILPGEWLTDGDAFTNIVHKADLITALHELPANPLSGFMTDNPLTRRGIPIFVALFELFFFVALFGVAWRKLMMGIAVVFQSLNALLLAVTFAPLLICYGIWVDWDRWIPRLRPPRGVGLAVALVLALGWNTTDLVRDVVNVGGLLDQRSIFWPTLFAGVVWIVAGVQGLGGRRRPRGG